MSPARSNATLADLEKRIPAIKWRQAAPITIKPDLMGQASADPANAKSNETVYACRVCIANYGFRPAHWRENDYSFETTEEFDQHMKEAHGVNPST